MKSKHPCHSAGILPICKNQILLGKEHRGWSAFGGKSEEGETPNVTAMREFKEETAGIFQQVKVDSNSCVVETSTPRGFPFFLFLIEFPHADKQVNDEFQRKRKLTNDKREKEKKNIEWIDISDVTKLRLSSSFAMDWQLVKTKILSEKMRKGHHLDSNALTGD